MRAKVKKGGAARILPCADCRVVWVRSLFPGTLGALYQQRAALVAAPGARGPPPGERGRSARHPPRAEGGTTPGKGGERGGRGPAKQQPTDKHHGRRSTVRAARPRPDLGAVQKNFAIT